MENQIGGSMKIKQSIFCSSTLIVVFIAITCSLSYYSSTVFKQLQEVDRNNEILLNLAAELRESSANLTSHVRSYVATKDANFKSAYDSTVAIRNGTEPRPSSSTIAPGQRIPLLDLLRQYGVSAEEFALLEEGNNLSNTLVKLEVSAMNAIEGKGEYSSPDQALAMELVFGQAYQNQAQRIMEPINNFFFTLTKRTHLLAAEIEEKFEKSVLISIIFSLLTLITSCIVFFSIYKQVVMPIIETTHVAKYVADGNLTLKSEQDAQFTAMAGRKNEIADLVNALKTMIGNLAKMVHESDEKTKQAHVAMDQAREATQAAEQAAKQAATARSQGLYDAATRLEGIVNAISTASTQLSAQIEISNQGADEQSARMTETAAAMDEMNSTVLEVARNSSMSAKIADSTKERAINGAKITQKCQMSMEYVKDESLKLRQNMSELASHAQSISAIMSVISDIADQTNLLALNAAIEAARAGEAGRGFAVVADEVRKLAEKTIASTTDVANAINAIQLSTEVNVKQVDAAVARIEEATELAVEGGQALQMILEMAEQSADGIRAIATASEEQSATSDEVARSISTVSGIADTTVQSMAEATQAIVSLSEQAHELSALVESLKNDS